MEEVNDELSYCAILPQALIANVSENESSSAWFDPDGGLDLSALGRLINGYVTLACFAFGLVTNALCLGVFSRFAKPRSAICTYLSALACWDILLLTGAFLLYCLPTILFGRVPFTGTYVHTYRPAFVLSHASLTASVWILIALIVNRYRALTYPLQHHVVGSAASAPWTVWAVSFLAILITIPRYFELTTKDCLQIQPLTDDVQKTVMIDLSALGRNKDYTLFYRLIGGIVTYSLVPYAVILVLTLRLAFHLHKNDFERTHCSGISTYFPCNIKNIE